MLCLPCRTLARLTLPLHLPTCKTVVITFTSLQHHLPSQIYLHTISITLHPFLQRRCLFLTLFYLDCRYLYIFLPVTPASYNSYCIIFLTTPVHYLHLTHLSTISTSFLPVTWLPLPGHLATCNILIISSTSPYSPSSYLNCSCLN